MMGYAIQKRGCHLGIAEDRDPLAELQIGGDDNAGLLIELADQMEQQCTAGLGERDIAQLVDDYAVQGRELPDDLPGIALGLFLDQGVDQVDSVKETGLLAVIDQGGSKRDGDMSFAGSGSAHQDEIVRLLGELACAERFDLGLGDGGRTVIEGGEVLVMGELRDAHLILDGAHPPLYSLGVDQLLYRCGQTWWLARGQQIMGECHELCVSGPVHAGFKYSHALKRSSNMIANWFRAANHSRTFLPPFSKLRIARYISLVAASSVGNEPRVLMDFRITRFRLSMAFVV